MTQTLEPAQVGELGNYTDEEGITHIHIFDTGKKYVLVDGQWQESEPF